MSSAALNKRVRRASLWTMAGHGIAQILRLVNNLILWRLLPAEDFGLMAIVMSCLVGLNFFSDVGIGPSIIQNDRGDDPNYLNTAWTIQAVREFVLCSAACLIAAPVAAFYKQPMLAKLLPAVALGSLCMGFNSTRLFTATRTMSLGRLTAIDFVCQVTGLTIMIVWAWLYRSIWALVLGTAVSNILRVILGHTILPGIRNRFHWDAASARTMLRFGRWVFISTMLTFFVAQSDRLIFGKMIPMAMLGVYSIAATWVSMSQGLAGRVFSSVLFPLLSRLHHEKVNLTKDYLRVRKPWLLLCGCTAACLIAGGPTLIRLLYQAKAESAGWIIQILSVGVWLASLESANSTAMLAMGEPKWLAAGNASKLVGMAVLIPLAYLLFGFPGAVAGLAGSELPHYLTSVIGTRRRKVSCLAQDIRLTVLVGVTGAIGLFAAHWIGPMVQNMSVRPAKLGIFIEGLVIFIFTSALWALVLLRDRLRKRQAAAVAA
jgi:O-antigen/teichoic acid export membrane protein